MTPYTERRKAGHYDPKPQGQKTKPADKSTTTDKLEGLTGKQPKAAK